MRLAGDFVLFRVFAVFFTRGRFSAPTSADTSNVQRTRRPDRSGESLICCFFGTKQVGATHVPLDFSWEFAPSPGRPLQNCRATFNSSGVFSLDRNHLAGGASRVAHASHGGHEDCHVDAASLGLVRARPSVLGS